MIEHVLVQLRLTFETVNEQSILLMLLYLQLEVILVYGEKVHREEMKTQVYDGYHLALKAGCRLSDMEMVQFHPTGMAYPEEMAGTLVNKLFEVKVVT